MCSSICTILVQFWTDVCSCGVTFVQLRCRVKVNVMFSTNCSTKSFADRKGIIGCATVSIPQKTPLLSVEVHDGDC